MAARRSAGRGFGGDDIFSSLSSHYGRFNKFSYVMRGRLAYQRSTCYSESDFVHSSRIRIHDFKEFYLLVWVGFLWGCIVYTRRYVTRRDT